MSCYRLQSTIKRSQGRNSGTETETTAYGLPLHGLLSYNREPPAQGAGRSHINHKSRKRPTDMPANQADGDSFSLEVVLSSQGTLACDKN